jgi:hypothetical protein
MAACSGLSMASLITVNFDPSQTTPPGQAGSPPPASTASNDFTLWGVHYLLGGGDGNGCASIGGDSLCFGDVIGSSGLGLSLLTDPVLEGPIANMSGTASSTLTLIFLSPTTVLDFSVVVGTSIASDECPVIVALSGPLYAGGTPACYLPNDSPITEGRFTYSGSPITQAVLSFPSDAFTSRTVFAFDNLTYEVPGPQAPEPGSLPLLGAGTLALLMFGFGRRFRSLRSVSGPYSANTSPRA